ncbi:MAG: hypothetical protein U9N59_07290 [Campylobacterota bacterium]|nr:hypothetical protein [Campylobacterota bacterium]
MKILFYISLLFTLVSANYMPCIIINEDAKIYNNDGERTDNTLKFGEFLYSNQESGKLQNIFKKSTNTEYTYIGWTLKSNTKCGVFSGSAINTEKLKKNNQIINLHSKILVVNQLAINNNQSYTEPISIYNSSNRNGINGTVRMYEVYFKLKEQNNRILLSKSSSITSFNTEHMVGWVDKKNIRMWNNRIGYNPIGETRYWTNQRNINNNRPTIRQNIQVLKYFDPRYPQLMANTGRKGIMKINKIEDNRGFSDIKQALTKAINQDTIYIAFLIDATEGMNPYIQNVKVGIREFIELKTNKKRIKIAIAYYRDTVDNVKYKLLTNFTTPTKAMRFLSTINATSSSKDNESEYIRHGFSPNVAEAKSKLESMFNGINSTINNLNFSKENMESHLIVIGDHGNHRENEDQKISDIAGKLNNKKNNIVLDAVMINSKKQIYQPYNDIFKNQITQIQRLNDNKGVFLSTSGTSATIKNAIQKIHDSFVDTQNKLLDCVSHMTRYNCEDINRMAKTPETIDNFLRGQASFDLFINLNNGNFQTDILIDTTILNNLVAMLGNLIETIKGGRISDPDAPMYFKRSIETTLKAISGESDDFTIDTNIQAYLIEKAAFPPNNQSLLNYSLSDLLDTFRTNSTFLNNYLEKLSLKYERLKCLNSEYCCNDGLYEWNSKKRKHICEDGKGIIHSKHEISIRKNDDNNQNGVWVWVPLKYLP